MLCVRRGIRFMKIKISEMLDNSVEILTKERTDIDNLTDIQDMVYKKIIRRKKQSYFLKSVAAVGTICLVTGSIVLAKTLLDPGGKVEKIENLVEEHTLYESDTEEEKIVIDIQTELLNKDCLYQNGIPIAKHILEIQTDFYTADQQIYVENGTMLILQDQGKGIFLEENEKVKISVKQENMNKQPGHTFEIGYIENGKPFKVDTVEVEQYEVWLKGGTQREYFPYFKNISSDRIILNYHIVKESMEKAIMALLVMTTNSTSVQAAEPQSNTMHQQSERMGISSTALSAGETINIIDNDGMAFYVPGGTKISFSISLKASGSVEMGYKNSNGVRTKKYSGTGKSHSTTFTIRSTGYYKFYITNKSSSTISITGGSLNF